MHLMAQQASSCCRLPLPAELQRDIEVNHIPRAVAKDGSRADDGQILEKYRCRVLNIGGSGIRDWGVTSITLLGQTPKMGARPMMDRSGEKIGCTHGLAVQNCCHCQQYIPKAEQYCSRDSST